MAAPTALAAEFEPFLHARVGTEPNGCELTILSLIARLDSDPWGEAARLAGQPMGAAVDWLAQRIALTRLSGMGALDARPTAERLVLLLPTHGTTPQAGTRGQIGGTEVPQWAILLTLFGALILGAAANTLQEPGRNTLQVTTPSPR